jgi:hypothetical protein
MHTDVFFDLLELIHALVSGLLSLSHTHPLSQGTAGDHTPGKRTFEVSACIS